MTPAQTRFVLAFPGVIMLGIAMGLSIESVHDAIARSTDMPPVLAMLPTAALAVALPVVLAARYIVRITRGYTATAIAVSSWTGLHLIHGLLHSPDTGAAQALAHGAFVPAAAAVMAIGAGIIRTEPHPAQENPA